VPCETSKLWKSDGVVHCSVENATVSCVNQRERLTQYWASPSEERRRRRRRKTIWPFCCYLVGYFRDAFSRHWESCWPWKHSKMNIMLSWRLISSPFLRFGEILMYCHILRVRTIPTLESTDSMIQPIPYTWSAERGTTVVAQIWYRQHCDSLLWVGIFNTY